MNNEHHISADTVRTLVQNVRRVAELRHISLDGIQPVQWEGITLPRVGNESLLRIVLFVGLVMQRNGIGLHEVLCEDPELMQQAMAIGDMMLYYQQYPQGGAGAGAGAGAV